MSTRYLSWPEAFDLFVEHIVLFQEHRAKGLNVAQAGAAIGIAPEAARKYDDTISRLMADVKSEAAPSPARLETAPEKAHHNTSEGVTAP